MSDRLTWHTKHTIECFFLWANARGGFYSIEAFANEKIITSHFYVYFTTRLGERECLYRQILNVREAKEIVDRDNVREVLESVRSGDSDV